MSDIRANAEGLAGILSRTLAHKFRIRDKVTYVVTDNTNVMPAAVGNMGLISLPCWCHVFNLMLKDVIDAYLPQIQLFITFAGTVANSTRFAKVLHHAHYSLLPTFTPTRWFSMYKLMRNCVADREQIEKYLDQERTAGRTDLRFGADCWRAAEILTSVLATFRNVCLMLEGDNFGSVSRVYQGFLLVQKACLDVDHRTMKDAWGKAARHWHKFLEKGKRIIGMATLLNPSVRLDVLPSTSVTDAKDALREEIRLRNAGPRSLSQSPQRLEPSPVPMKQGLTLSDLIADDDEKHMDEVDRFLLVDRRQMSKDTEFDLLWWWRHNQKLYPALWTIARSVLIIPASSAAAERQFSKAKRIQGLRRQSLNAGTLAAMVFVCENKELAKQLLFHDGSESEGTLESATST
jgi:hypothetical protein